MISSTFPCFPTTATVLFSRLFINSYKPGPHFLLCRINKDALGLNWQILEAACPRETMWHCFYPINLDARSLRIVNKVSSGCLEYLRTRPTKKRSLAKITLTEDENDSNDGIPKYLIVLRGFFFSYIFVLNYVVLHVTIFLTNKKNTCFPNLSPFKWLSIVLFQ